MDCPSIASWWGPKRKETPQPVQVSDQGAGVFQIQVSICPSPLLGNHGVWWIPSWGMLLGCWLLGSGVLLTPGSFGVISWMGDHGEISSMWWRDGTLEAEGAVLPRGDQGQDQHLQHPHEELSRKGKVLLLLHIEQSRCVRWELRNGHWSWAEGSNLIHLPFSQQDPALSLVPSWQPFLVALKDTVWPSLTGSWVSNGKYCPCGKPGCEPERGMWGWSSPKNTLGSIT